MRASRLPPVREPGREAGPGPDSAGVRGLLWNADGAARGPIDVRGRTDMDVSGRYDDIAEPGRDAAERWTVGIGIIDRLGGRGGGTRVGVSGWNGK
jgi:hypothetical protein